MRQRWNDRQVQNALDLAVESFAGRRTPSELLEVRRDDAYLGLVPLEGAASSWALVAMITPRGGRPTPHELLSVVRVDRDNYFAEGAAWWPEPGSPHWAWAVGRAPKGAIEVMATYTGVSKVLPISEAGWFGHITPLHEQGDRIAVSVRDGTGLRGL